METESNSGALTQDSRVDIVPKNVQTLRFKLTEQQSRPIISRENVFDYKPLDRSKGSVRLIRVFPLRQNDFIRCRIERHHISTAQYVALSYVWGSQEANCKILLNGQTFMVRGNLFAFLRYLSKTAYSTDTLFWIDAICIDQNNVVEKNHHINHMGTIYRRASKVISWLGNSSCYTLSGVEPPGPWICCEAFMFDKEVGRRHRCEWRIPYTTSWTLLRHEYWDRLWVAQELSLAKRVDILYRSRYYSWSQIIKCLSKNMLQLREQNSQSPASSQMSLAENMSYLGLLPVARYLKSTSSAPLRDLVPRFALHQCQVGFDHAFALLSMASDGIYFEPDYNEQCISLLFRLLTFFKTSPSTSFVSKIGTALDLCPSTTGILMKFVGRPVVLETTEMVAKYFRSVDRLLGPLRDTDILVQIPDTNLYLLCREELYHTAETTYTVFARVDAVSLRVEHGRKKFTNSRQNKAIPSSGTTPLSKSTAWKNAHLKKDFRTDSFCLYCDWQTVLFIFDYSRTMSTPGRLESRIREWLLPQDIAVEDSVKFIIGK